MCLLNFIFAHVYVYEFEILVETDREQTRQSRTYYYTGSDGKVLKYQRFQSLMHYHVPTNTKGPLRTYLKLIDAYCKVDIYYEFHNKYQLS